MKTIDELRKNVDKLDSNIARLLAQRARLVQRIGEAKQGFPVYDPDREREVIDNIKQHVPPEFSGFIQSLYREIIRHFRELETEMVE